MLPYRTLLRKNINIPVNEDDNDFNYKKNKEEGTMTEHIKIPLERIAVLVPKARTKN